jgi:hypothetical protein
MCDFATLQVIEQVTQDKTQNGQLFTAHDITRAVRAQVGRGTNVPHREVRQEVHNLFANGQFGADYTRSLANLPGINPQPWVYHRNTDDPSTYVSALAGPNALPVAADPASLIGVMQGANDNDDAVNKLPNGSFQVDGRDTLCLPANLCRDAGLQPRTEAFVAHDFVNGVVVVSKDEEPSFTPLSKYTVDSYANVRITQHTLQKAGLGGKVFDIDLVNSGSDNFVRVKKHS